MAQELRTLTADDILIMVKRGETDKIRFFDPSEKPLQFARLVAGQASHEGGHVLVGVVGPGQVIGTTQGLTKALVGTAMTMMFPIPSLRVCEVFIQGKCVGAVKVERAGRSVKVREIPSRRKEQQIGQ